MQAQIFIYILALVIGAGILIYGYNAVTGFKKQADDILYLQFENSLKNDLKSISYESIKRKTYDMPAAINQICFRTIDAVYTDVTDEQIRQNNKYKYPLIEAAIQAETQDNVFLYPKGDKSFFGGINIDLGTNVKFKCFNVESGILSITLKGQGSSVAITD